MSLNNEALWMAALVARLVEYGIPLHTIDTVFDKDTMTLLRAMKCGFHSRRSHERYCRKKKLLFEIVQRMIYVTFP